MEQYVVKGGVPLRGEVSIGGAKNAALGILAAAIMTDETIPFDFDSFAFMDDGVPYLNPKHFSVMQLIAVMESASHG